MHTSAINQYQLLRDNVEATQSYLDEIRREILKLRGGSNSTKTSMTTRRLQQLSQDITESREMIVALEKKKSLLKAQLQKAFASIARFIRVIGCKIPAGLLHDDLQSENKLLISVAENKEGHFNKVDTNKDQTNPNHPIKVRSEVNGRGSLSIDSPGRKNNYTATTVSSTNEALDLKGSQKRRSKNQLKKSSSKKVTTSNMKLQERHPDAPNKIFIESNEKKSKLQSHQKSRESLDLSSTLSSVSSCQLLDSERKDAAKIAELERFIIEHNVFEFMGILEERVNEILFASAVKRAHKNGLVPSLDSILCELANRGKKNIPLNEDGLLREGLVLSAKIPSMNLGLHLEKKTTTKKREFDQRICIFLSLICFLLCCMESI